LTIRKPSSPAETLLAGRIAEAYAHAWLTLQLRPSRWRPAGAGGRLARAAAAIAVAAAAAALVALPVRLSALAPVEVAAQDPVVVAAPAEGVIAEIPVRPNQAVSAGDVLFRLDDTAVRNRHAVAERTLKVAEAELQQATKKAFQDADSSARVAVLRARAEERRAELAYLAELLGRLQVHADRAGVVVLRDANEWLGRPVRIGEQVLLLADPAQVRLTAWLPVDGAIPIAAGAAMQAFLNVDPLAPLAAVVERQSYEAEVTPQGVLAHRVEAHLADGTPPPQIGLKGTAKLYGDEVSLGYYLLRAPLAALRRLVAF
jgi:multidrug efflux pump subunit AcrA (membrane-fusion protein)